MHVVILDTKSILRYLSENTLLPDDYTVKSRKLQKRAADSKDLFYRKAIFMYVSENIYGHHILGRWIGEYQVQLCFESSSMCFSKLIRKLRSVEEKGKCSCVQALSK